MKSLSLSLALAALSLGLPAASAQASIITITNTSMATACLGYAERRDRNPEALAVCTRALNFEALDTQNRSATLVNRGVLRMIHRDFRGAEKDFDDALAIDPAQSDAWLNKGFIRLQTGEGASALPYLERAMAVGIRRPALAYFARGIAHEQAGNVRAAFADLNRARDMEPGWAMPAEALTRYRVVTR
jgi:tetratricopeptide (TPR) repeat protein